MDDESESEELVFIRLFINQEYTRTENFDTKRDVFKLAELEKNNIKLNELQGDIPQAFRKVKFCKKLWNDVRWEYKIVSYDDPDLEIDDDEALEDEIDACDPDDDMDDPNSNRYVKLRVIFFPGMLSSKFIT